MVSRWARLLAVLLTTLCATALLALGAQPASAAVELFYGVFSPKAYCVDMGRNLVASGDYSSYRCVPSVVAGSWWLFVRG